MSCDKCYREAEGLYRMMPLCSTHKEQVKRYRQENRAKRQAEGAKNPTARKS